MTKKLNKHTPNSEELFSRLDSNNSEGLDDFEKEALEGFSSIENNDVAKELHSKLDARINEVYFEKKNSRSPLYYLSFAAGLILVIGLSYVFYNFLNEQKQELALNKDVVQEEKLLEMSALVSETQDEESTISPITTSSDEKLLKSLDDRDGATFAKTEKKADEFESKADESAKNRQTIDAEISSNVSSGEVNNGPVTLATTKVAEAQKAPAPMDVLSEKDMPEKSAPAEDKSSGKMNPRSTVPIGGVNKKATAEETPLRKEKSKKENEGLASDYKEVQTKSQSAPGAAAGALEVLKNDRDVNSNLSQPVFQYKSFNKAQDYLKIEIDKNEILKNTIKEFTAKLNINENGTVTKVKFVSTFKNCNTCEKELESILLKMPNWQAATSGGKKVKETIHFVYP